MVIPWRWRFRAKWSPVRAKKTRKKFLVRVAHGGNDDVGKDIHRRKAFLGFAGLPPPSSQGRDRDNDGEILSGRG
ncbi:hypothetical protein [Bradyrhizobium sp. BR 1433]|uniref:hypothetical protein n=1 Tax=Bradyrhizobium sp. BR 1433 TaxID=3447967 RepID=UPI003EE60281